MPQFQDVPLTEESSLRIWRRIPDGRTVVEVWEDEVPEDAEGKGRPPLLLARLFLDDEGRQQLADALTAEPEPNDLRVGDMRAELWPVGVEPA